MPLLPGTTLGHYEVTALIGEGGMGEVYQATDTKLNRQVALKILPEAFASDPDRLARFQREAQVLASLNHPNIAAIHGLEDSQGTKALVLELVEGPTLAARIAKGPIPLDEALPIAKQIAEALEAAHEAGVIHRDLKPANVKIRADGTVKVLDFGLAKALNPTASGAASGDPAHDLTRTSSATQLGVIMGTPAYMSPEQASGIPIDKRSDVWSFGVVVYEMLTGRTVFEGSTAAHVIASILKTDPDWTWLPSSTPSSIRRLLRRCLHKELKGRIPDVGIARIEIEEALNPVDPSLSDVSMAPEFRVPPVRVWQRPVSVALIALLAATGAGLAVRSLTDAELPARPVSRFAIPEDTQNGLALSPDGRSLVYTVIRDDVPRLVARARDQLEALPIPGTEGGYSPFFSPDGRSLGFFAAGALKRVDLAGGPSFTLTEAGPPGASWGAGGEVVFGDRRRGLMLVPETGGEPRQLTTSGPGERHLWPQFLPGGDHVVFTRWTTGDPPGMQVAVITVETGEFHTLVEGTSPRYASTGHLVFARDSSLWAVAFDAGRLEITGEPTPIVENVQLNMPGGWTHYALSGDGTLVYLPSDRVETARSLVLVDREGQEESLPGVDAGDYRDVSWSPDGTRLVLTRDLANLWTYDLTRGVLSQLTTATDVVNENPVWTPGGERVVYTSTREGVTQLMWKAADGTGLAETLWSPDRVSVPIASGWSPDGRLLFMSVSRGQSEGSPSTFQTFALAPGDRGTPERLFDTEFPPGSLAVSPDGKWVAYHSSLARLGPEADVYVERYPELGGRQQVSTSGGRYARWSADGAELFYMSRDGRQVFAVPVVPGERLTVGIPKLLFDGSYLASIGRGRPFDVSPDGERFVLVKPPATSVGAPRSLVVVQNWFEELTARVPRP